MYCKILKIYHCKRSKKAAVWFYDGVLYSEGPDQTAPF